LQLIDEYEKRYNVSKKNYNELFGKYEEITFT
jgi:hypothetical protein